jgi:hypothetical protein
MIKKNILLSMLIAMLLMAGIVSARPHNPNIRAYVYMLRPLACGAQITAEDVVLRLPVPQQDIIPFTGYQRTQAVIGKYMNVHIGADEALIAVYLVDKPSQLTNC